MECARLIDRSFDLAPVCLCSSWEDERRRQDRAVRHGKAIAIRRFLLSILLLI